MHYESHIFAYCIALWCVINVGKTARSAINPEILTNFAKNVATVLSPAVLGDIQSRRNRSSLQSTLTESLQLDENDSDSSSTLDNIVDNTSNTGSYYRSDSYPYNELSAEKFDESEENEQLKEPLREYLQQERPHVYRPYDFPANNNNAEATQKSVDTASIEQSSTNLFSSYLGAGIPKTAFHGAFLAKPDPGFYGFGPYGHGYHHHHHHHYPYGSGESSEENARQENATDHRGYGPPFGGHGYGHPYSPFPQYAGYGHHDPFYGPYRHNGNDSNGHYGHRGPYHGGPDFYGPSYGHYGHGYNRNGNDNNNDNSNNNNNRQTEEPADNDQSNSTKNGYRHHYGPLYGPPKPVLGFPFPFSPYHHFYGGFKAGPVGVGHIGYPLYADPYLIGFPFHPYGPFFHGKKYLPKGKPDSGESGESTEIPAGELSQNENPERITGLNQEEIAPASSSNQYKTSGRKDLKVSLINLERKV